MSFNLEVCVNCPLNKTPVLSKEVTNPKYVIIGEAPGAVEDHYGEPFIGPAGKVLDKLLASAGIDRSDCYVTNTIKCYPTVDGQTRKPKPKEIKHCSQGLWPELEATGATVLITLGAVPLSLFTDKSISMLHGKSFTANGYTIIPMYHPAAAMHNPNLRSTLEVDYAKLKSMVKVANIDYQLIRGAVAPLEGLCAIDLETNADESIKCAAVCWETDKAYWSRYPLHDFDGIVPIFHNAKADAKWLGYDLKTKDFEDTMLMAAVTSNYPVGLKALAPTKCNIVMDSLEQLRQQTKAKTIFDIPLEVLGPYNAKDALATYRLYHALREEWYTSADSLYTMEKQLVPVVMGMEDRGVKVNLKLLGDIDAELDARIAAIVNKYEFNILSNQQLGEKLLASGVRLTKRTAEGAYCVDESVLFPLKQQSTLAADVLEIRGLQKERSTYVQRLMEDADNDCRVHTSYNQAGAATGRWSSSGPNLQNIKRGRMRQAFVAKPGFVLVKGDVSQAELKVLAWFSQDPVMLDAYRTGKDIHDITERAIFGTSHVNRVAAKTTNFSVIYGIGAKSLAENLSSQGVQTTPRQAQSYIDGFYTTYRGVKKYREELTESAKSSCILHNWYGRMYRIEKLKYKDSFDEGMRMAMDYPIQGTVADYVKQLMLLHPDWPYVLQVHDEVVLEVPESEGMDYARELLVAHTKVEFPLPLNLEVKIGKNWGEMKEVK